MAKYKCEPIVQDDLIAYLTSESDFAFEQRVFAEVSRFTKDVRHSGTYTDPVSKKPREYDIRAIKMVEDRFLNQSFWLELALAVECKNIGKHAPLLVSTVPRQEEEAFHDIISVRKVTEGMSGPPFTVHRVVRQLYAIGNPVGKDCRRVGKLLSGDLSGDDSEIYDKWSQALSSAHDLVAQATAHRTDRSTSSYHRVTAVLPVVVVPDETLWAVAFDGKGDQTGEPVEVTHVDYFVGHAVPNEGTKVMEISHLVFCTLAGFSSLIERLCGTASDGLFSSWHLKQI